MIGYIYNTIKKSIFLIIVTVNGYSQPFNLTASLPYSNSAASGQYLIYRSATDSSIQLNQIRKPIVFVEGFDPNSLYQVPDIYKLLNEYRLARSLHTNGHDIAILNFNSGGDYIQRNAMLLVELINQINANKPNQSEDLVVIGFSMGGLVARYALTYMEQHNMNHKTRLYVSYDAPHKGAHIPLSIQALATSFNYEPLLSLFPDLQKSLNLFRTPAAKQMLRYRLNGATQDNGSISPPTEFNDFYNELKSLNNCNGFPKNCKNIALSLGSWNAIGQRSNLDLDGNGIKDLQHSGFPAVTINIPHSTASETKPIWTLNTCQLVSALTFQVVLSSSPSNLYPYFSQRSAYASLGDYSPETYWYVNTELSPISILFPSGSFSRKWNTDNLQPYDFAPGSNIDGYDQLVTGLNSTTQDASVQCSFAYISNSTFVPTVSALAYETTDLFENISANTSKLQKTPFEAIWGVDGENQSHKSDQTSLSSLRTWLIDQIDGTHPRVCLQKEVNLTNQTILNAQVINISGVSDVTANNYTINSGANVTFASSNRIDMKDGFRSKLNSNFRAKIVPCPPKACEWSPSSSGNRLSIDEINLVPIKSSNAKGLSAHPNPVWFTTTLSYKVAQKGNVKLYIIDGLGLKVAEVLNENMHEAGQFEIEYTNSSLSSGIYLVVLEAEGVKETIRLVVVR